MGGGAILLSKPCIAKGLVSSCCSAAKRRNTASAPCQNIHYHHGGPKTEDYHPSASQSLMTWKLTNSQLAALSTAGQLGKPTACNSNLAQIACLRKDMRGNAALHLNTENTLSFRGGERDEWRCNADKFRERGLGTSGWVRWSPMGILSQNVSHHRDADRW